MKREDVVKQYTTPPGSPAFPRGPYRFTDREYLNITYRTDREALRAAVPEPLEIDEPLVRFEVMKHARHHRLRLLHRMRAGDLVRFGEEKRRIHASRMYLDNLPAIAAGREVSAYPKKLGSPKLYIDSDTLVGTLDYGSLQRGDGDDGLQAQAARPGRGQGGNLRAHLHAEDHLELRRAPAHLRAGAHGDHQHHGQGRVDRPGAAAAVRARAGAAGGLSRAGDRFGQPHPDRPDARAAEAGSTTTSTTSPEPAAGRRRKENLPMPSSRDSPAAVLDRYRNVAVIGAGVIGASWTALFLAHGLKVVVNDPRPTSRPSSKSDLQKISRRRLRALGLPTDDLDKQPALRARPRTRGRWRRPRAGERPGAHRVQAGAVGAHRARRAAPRAAAVVELGADRHRAGGAT